MRDFNRMFKLNGLLGLLVLVLSVLAGASLVAVSAVGVQKRESTNYYSLDTGSLKMKDRDNSGALLLLKDAK